MAAIDPTPRSHILRDVVLAAASLALLVGVMLVGVRDYNQGWKQAQRQFRELESVRAEPDGQR